MNRISRRELFLYSGAASIANPSSQAQAPDSSQKPWHQRVKRCGQTNLNEKDLQGCDVDGWADYWADLKVDAVLLNGGGVVAYYPTRVPFHHRSEFLGTRDVLGDFIAAVKKRGMRVVARMDPNFACEDALRARPEWFQRTEDGKTPNDPESTWLFRTCMFSSYFTEQLPAILREVNTLYDVDGFFTNGWPTTGQPTICYCENCRRMFRDEIGGIPQQTLPTDLHYRKYLDVHANRVQQIWVLWDRTVKEKKADSIFYGNLHTNIRAYRNLKKIAEVAAWFNLDGQDRGGDTNPLWFCSQQGRAAQSVMQGRTITNVAGAYASSSFTAWRHTSKSPEEVTLWLAQTVACGMAPTYHWLGASPEDNRWREAGRKFFRWMAANDPHFRNRRSLADIGLVLSQSTIKYYEGLRSKGDRFERTDSFQGVYYALLEGRHAFDFVHEDNLDAKSLGQYRALLLPNVALLSAGQCEQLREYVRNGGALFADYETSLYDEWGGRRSDFGLADLFGANATGPAQGPLRNSYARVDDMRHELVSGLAQPLLPGGLFRVPIRQTAGPRPPLTYMPPYPSHPPEMVYPRVKRTDEPAVVVNRYGRGAAIYFPADLDRTYWRTSNPDLGRLLQNAIRYAVHLGRGGVRPPVEVTGDGVVELWPWETEPGIAIHIVNYTNPHMLGGWVRNYYAIGPQQVVVSIPADFKVSAVRVLRAGKDIPFRSERGSVSFEVPSVIDFEVAAIVRG